VLRGNGDGSFGTAESLETGGDTTSVTSADFDDDGAPDLAIANSADDDVSIFLDVSRTRGPARGSALERGRHSEPLGLLVSK